MGATISPAAQAARDLIESRFAEAYWNDNRVDLAEGQAILRALVADDVTDIELGVATELLELAAENAPVLEEHYRATRDLVERLQGRSSLTPEQEIALKDGLLRLSELAGELDQNYEKMRVYSRLVRGLEEHPSMARRRQ